MMKTRVAGVFLAVALCGTIPAGAGELDWWQAEQAIVERLASGTGTLAGLVVQVTARAPETDAQALTKLLVLMRAGMTREATTALGELKQLSPALPSSLAERLYCAAFDEYCDPDLARAVVEVFADRLRDLSLDGRLLRYLLDSGWTVERVDEWLAEKPAGIDGFWIKHRLAFAAEHGRAEALARQYSAAARRNPQDIPAVLVYLDALAFGRRTGQETWDVAWIADEVKPRRATEACRLAEGLRRLGENHAAARFYRHAIATDLTDAEVEERAGLMQAVWPPDRIRAGFAVGAREELARCLLDLGQNDEAQRVMVEAADIREKHQLGLAAILAGQVQAASGQRTIEGRIREQEPLSGDDPRYWMSRADYYRGRGEPAEEETAWKKALALTAPQMRPDRPGKGWADQRGGVLQRYADFLARQNRRPEAVALLRAELRQVPATTETAQRVARVLAFDFAASLQVDDEVLWTYLARRPNWEHAEERLLRRMLEQAGKEERDRWFGRAEQLARGTDPSRAYALGWILNRMGAAQRSLAQLEDALKRAPDGESKERAAFTLLESCLETGSWKRAEEVFPVARARLTPGELTGWQSRIAVSAARAGAKADALRIWCAAAAVNPGEMDGLPELARAGLRSELAGFYREMQARWPSSRYPAAALVILGE